MRVAVLSSHTPSLFWFRMDMMKEFQERGHEVHAIANEPEEIWTHKFAGHNIIYHQINVQRNAVDPFGDLKCLLSIKSVLSEIKPDKIFAFQAKTVIYGSIAANQLGITEVYPLIAGLGSVFLSDSLKSRAILAILTKEYKYAMRKCPTVFFQNQDDEDIFRKYRMVNKQKVVHIHGSGVNIDEFRVTQLPRRPAFLCISRLIRDKGVYEYLEACRMLKFMHPEIRCLLVGPYDTNPSALKPEELEPFIKEGIIEYFGEQKDVRPYIEQASVFVLPSYREGTPKTNLEAMACGRAVITTNAPGCKETVVDGENGFLVPAKDINALCKEMIWFVEHPDRIEQMGRNGRRKAEDIFDVKKVNRSICEAMDL